jgi:hypothetical protein
MLRGDQFKAAAAVGLLSLFLRDVINHDVNPLRLIAVLLSSILLMARLASRSKSSPMMSEATSRMDTTVSTRALSLLDLNQDLRCSIMVYFVSPEALLASSGIADLAGLRGVCSSFRTDFRQCVVMLASAGSVSALVRVTRSHVTGDFGFEKSAALYRAAMNSLVEHGSNAALTWAASMSFDAGDCEFAVGLWKQLANGGDSGGMYNYATCLLGGTHCAKDCSAAYKLLRTGSEQGHPSCKVSLGKGLWDGESPCGSPMTKDRSEALGLFQAAAAAGNSEGMLCTAMGCCAAWMHLDQPTAQRDLYAINCLRLLRGAAAAGNAAAARILKGKEWDCLQTLDYPLQ